MEDLFELRLMNKLFANGVLLAAYESGRLSGYHFANSIDVVRHGKVPYCDELWRLFCPSLKRKVLAMKYRKHCTQSTLFSTFFQRAVEVRMHEQGTRQSDRTAVDVLVHNMVEHIDFRLFDAYHSHNSRYLSWAPPWELAEYDRKIGSSSGDVSISIRVFQFFTQWKKWGRLTWAEEELQIWRYFND
ncbi:hypothetical protein BDV96DRAFT_651964 [Lophiotrema nucula]|uniref:Uncharacterized protein n=1 Tax=Lophiotrema nucula TaxID=690887 RepID=A0A6A5YRC8_9PLEO|nr:hypothetical protein BDV96DRAFT_651964 [Lophiotrema nucula]